ncbi:attractin-like isoform X2 [Pomacea canaliculata]|nr:attractin-like isoform X2 [Pomacea canaliculata]
MAGEVRSTVRFRISEKLFTDVLARLFISVTLVVFITHLNSVRCESLCKCDQGECVNGSCICYTGWSGNFCDTCGGRITVKDPEGFIFEGRGNYQKDMTCSWLVDTGVAHGNVSVRFVFYEFETECGWDHLYIHDGDSAFAPMLAAYSGLLLSKEEGNTSSFEINIRFSGQFGYLHFYSDAAYTMQGFNISYSIGGCYLNCSESGTCFNGECACDAGRSGMGCEIDMTFCLNNCSYSGVCLNGICNCDPGLRGEDCSSLESDVLWQPLSSVDPHLARASHVALQEGDILWIVGGYSLNSSAAIQLLKYSFKNDSWSTVPEGTKTPWPLYAHSAVKYQNRLYVYGGVRDGLVKDELWVYDIAGGSWNQTSVSGFPVSGHTAHVYNDTMLVFFGYSPLFGYVNRVQQYNFVTGMWTTLETKGAVVQGGYGHSSVYENNTGKIFVYGGYHSAMTSGSSSYNLTDRLYSYDPTEHSWLLLHSSGHPRYLQSMVAADDFLLVYGGNTHNDTTKSRGAKCYSSDFLLYDIKCNSWHNVTLPSLDNMSRFGHSMVAYNGFFILFGGFSGVMLNDLINITRGNCSSFENNSTCLSGVPGLRCVWNNGTCYPRSSTDLAEAVCDAEKRDFSPCPGYNTCSSCVNGGTQAACTWCGDKCTALNCTANEKVETLDNCSSLYSAGCSLYHTCQACQNDSRCAWEENICKARSIEAGVNVTTNKTSVVTCSKQPCAAFNTCSICAQNSCMWCSNLAVCIDTNAYVVSFPYGQCMDWTTKTSRCNATQCSGLKSCKECQANPMCGWCNNSTNTGLGMCMQGGQLGPVQLSPSGSSSGFRYTTAPQLCPAPQWFFTECPLCQCNGHSSCPANSSVCESCQFPTTGQYCESCQNFYYGNPMNGGNCSECQCNGQADSCNPEDGECYCRTRGVTGRYCDKCDDMHKYFGDPRNGGTCYYRLSTDYQYTFNLSKREDLNYTQINFISIPSSGDRDVDFTLNCSGPALLNITYKSKAEPGEKMITESQECGYFRTKFDHKNHAFGGEMNTTFFVYVYSFRTPFWLQISFSQFPKIDLVHFFVTFFSCFLSLLLIAALLWKIKHKYDSYRRRQQMMVEMQQMASRPFATVCVEVDRKTESASGGGIPERKELRDHVDSALRRRKKLTSKPSAVAIEPLSGSKAAVLTLLIQLPFGDGEFAPSGQSGMAVGSALIAIGTNRKQSLEHIKGDKPKMRKHIYHTHPDTYA